MPEPYRNGSAVDSPTPRPPLWRNVFSNWTAFAFTAGVAFFLSPFVVRSLGDSAYGAWVLLGSLVGYMGLLDLGVRAAVTRYIAKFYAEANHRRSSNLATSALVIFFVSGLVAITLAVLIAAFVVPAFRIPDDLIPESRIVVILGGATMAVTLISGVFEGIIVGRERFDYASGIDIGIEGLRALLIVIALLSGRGLVALASIQLGVTVLRGVTAYNVCRRLYPQLEVRPGNWNRQYIRLIFSFSVYTVLLQASGRIIMFTDSLVISAFLPVSLLTFYAIAANLIQYSRGIVSGIYYTYTPLTSALQARGQTLELQRMVLKGARFSTLVILPIVVTFVLRGGSFIGLWMGPQYADRSGAVLWVLALTVWTEGAYGIVAATMFGLDRHRGLVPIFFTEAIVNLGLSIWLVQRMGIIGVAWGTALPRLAVALIAGPWYLRRELGINARSFSFNAWVRPTAAMVPFAVGTYAIERAWSAPGLTIFFTQVAVALPLAGLGAWLLGLSAAERADYRRRLARRRPLNDASEAE